MKTIRYLSVIIVTVMLLSLTGCHILAGSGTLETADTATTGSQELMKNSLGMEFIFISPGAFTMGSPAEAPCRNDDETQHRVTLTRGFYMQTTEVTQGQWMAIMGHNPSSFKNCGTRCPVEDVTWEDVQEYIQKLNRQTGQNYRLPTEAEWEYACRAGTDGPFNTGNCLLTSQANYDGNFPLVGCPKGRFRQSPMPVASFAPNSWGLYDMHGNVWEWCSDWYGEYPFGSVTDPVGPSTGTHRVLRGGSWRSVAERCRSTDRRFRMPDNASERRGFRLVLPLAE